MVVRRNVFVVEGVDVDGLEFSTSTACRMSTETHTSLSMAAQHLQQPLNALSSRRS